MIDNYKSLCSLYYDFDKPFPPKDEYLFYLYYLKKYKLNILEPMCGSGRFLIPFLQDGYIIDAFDASSFMLYALNKKLLNKNIVTNFTQSLFFDYVFKKKYNLIYIPSASLSLIFDKKLFKDAVKVIFENLNFFGSFIFEVETPEILEKDALDFQLIANNFISISENKKILGSFINHSYVDNVLKISCRYDLIQKDIIVNTEFENIIVRLFSYKDILEILEDVGFKVICYENFNKKKYVLNSPLPKLLILECLKN